MRHIGSLPDESQARSLHSYLVTQQIRCMIEEEDGAWAIWIYEEDQLDRGKEELQAFRATPNDPKYAAAVREATQLAKEAQKKAKENQKRTVNVREQWERPLLSRAPVTVGLIALSIMITAVLTDLNAPWGRGMLSFGPRLSSKPLVEYFWVSDTDPTLPEIRSGQVWRMISPIFVHLSLLHILFNMIWTRDLGSAIELRIGSLKFLGVVLFCAVVSVLLTSQSSEGIYFGGMSGVVYGLAGYVYVKGRCHPELGLYLSPRLLRFFLFWLILGFMNVLGPISNYGHLYGLLAGAFIAYVPVAIRNLTGQ